MSFNTGALTQHRNWNLFLQGASAPVPPVPSFPFYAVNTGGATYGTSPDFGITWVDGIVTPIGSQVNTFAALSNAGIFMFANSGRVSAIDTGGGFAASALPSSEWNYAVKSETYAVAVRQTGAAANAHTSLDGGLTWNNTGAAIQCLGFCYSTFSDQFLISRSISGLLNIESTADGFSGFSTVFTAPKAIVRLGAFGACAVGAYQCVAGDPSYLFAVSSDGGNSFAQIDSGIPPNPFGVGDQSVNTLAGNGAGTVVCSFNSLEYGGVLTSNDNGATWLLVQPSALATFCFVMFDAASSKFYLLSLKSTAPVDTFLYSSSDGVNWALIHTWPGVVVYGGGIFSGTYKPGLSRHSR